MAKVIEPSFVIIEPNPIHQSAILAKLEVCGRTCYKSESKAGSDTAEGFVRSLVERGHESVIEHVSLTIRFIFDRGVSHEVVRHRLASFSQESTRFCNYSQDRFGNEITVIRPEFWEEGTSQYDVWLHAMEQAEQAYFRLLEMGALPQQARSVLPNSLKTEIVVTANLREWRLILKQRCSSAAHPQMRQIMCPLLAHLKETLPVIFGDINPM